MFLQYYKSVKSHARRTLLKEGDDSSHTPFIEGIGAVWVNGVFFRFAP